MRDAEFEVGMTTTALMNAVSELDKLASDPAAVPHLALDCADLMLAQHQLARVIQKLVSKVGVAA